MFYIHDWETRHTHYNDGLPKWLSGSRIHLQCRRGFHPWVWKIPQRRAVGYSPQGYKEPDAAEMTERARTHCKDKAFSTQSPNLVSLMQFMCVHAQLLQACLTLCDPVDGHLPDSSVQSILQTAILKCYTLFQGIFLTQGWNPSLLHCRQILYP